MKLIATILMIILYGGCASIPYTSSSPRDSSRPTDPQFTAQETTSKIAVKDLDKNLSRYYADQVGNLFSAIPITGALLDTIGFIRSEKDDYDKFAYKIVSNQYRAFLFNKTSCFFVFIRGSGDISKVGNYQITVRNNDSPEEKAVAKTEVEHLEVSKVLNEMFPKSYERIHPRSIETNSLYSQELVCSDKIDFQKPFSIQFKSESMTVELHWL